jgi:hypothetical protein
MGNNISNRKVRLAISVNSDWRGMMIDEERSFEMDTGDTN